MVGILEPNFSLSAGAAEFEPQKEARARLLCLTRALESESDALSQVFVHLLALRLCRWFILVRLPTLL